MKIIMILTVTLLAGAMAACSSTGTNPGAAAPAAVANSVHPQADDDGVIGESEQERLGIRCKRVPVTGSRFSKKVCTTQAQRDQMAKDAQTLHQDVTRTAKQTMPGSGN